jgi:hypothetical protein
MNVFTGEKFKLIRSFESVPLVLTQLRSFSFMNLFGVWMRFNPLICWMIERAFSKLEENPGMKRKLIEGDNQL